jgi:hypothetical protein
VHGFAGCDVFAKKAAHSCHVAGLNVKVVDAPNHNAAFTESPHDPDDASFAERGDGPRQTDPEAVAANDNGYSSFPSRAAGRTEDPKSLVELPSQRDEVFQVSVNFLERDNVVVLAQPMQDRNAFGASGVHQIKERSSIPRGEPE